MKIVAFSNNDIAVLAWSFSGKLPNCLGFAIYRIDVRAGTETCLPAMATFQGQDATPGRTTADDPVQKFFWKDVYAKRGGTYKYKVVPMTGAPGNMQPMPYGPLISNSVQLSPNYGVLSAYFNRGILATQSTAHKLKDGSAAGTLADKLQGHIETQGDPLRLELAGQMIEALTALSDEALKEGDEVYCALYEFDDPDAIAHLEALQRNANLILSNMPGTDANQQVIPDTYASERAAARDADVNVIDRFMKSGHIGHNKFQILVKDGMEEAVLFGSTNWTTHGLCAQTNNSIIARSPAVAKAYKNYWERLLTDTVPPGEDGKAQQSKEFRDANAEKIEPIKLEDGSGTVDIWFSPNTATQRQRNKANEAVPPDLDEVFQLIAAAQQAVLFLVFQPGSPSIVDAVADALRANPTLFVRGAVTAAQAADEFYTELHDGSNAKPAKKQKGDPSLPVDYRVVRAQGVTAGDAFGQWESELNQAGHAVIHDKIVVIDPFSDNCVVVTGSHNLGYQASYNNDENLVIIRGHRAIAEAYAAHCLDVYDHYAWRYWLSTDSANAWHFLAADDKWQDQYFSADNQVKSAELNFWLSSEPAANAIPAQHPNAATRVRPAIQDQTGGISPAVGPHAIKPNAKGKAQIKSKAAAKKKTTR